MRTIHISGDVSEMYNAPFNDAMGYLTTWAITKYDKAQIYCNAREMEITAKYTESKTGSIYVIGAIWHEDSEHFSFHS